MNGFVNWCDSLQWQIDFYQRSFRRKRCDREFNWDIVDRFSIMNLAIRTINNFRPSKNLNTWLVNNLDKLWESRSLLEDEFSKLLFDSTLVLRAVGHNKFYAHRMYFEDIVTVLSDSDFVHQDLPCIHLGEHFREFQLCYQDQKTECTFRVVATPGFIDTQNRYRQYLETRDGLNIIPVKDDVVLDCGACIGDTATLFLAMVGKNGAVHSFDPVPLHNRFCNYQRSVNPDLADSFFINQLAVGDRSFEAEGSRSDSDQIAPGGLAVDNFSCVTLDDYAEDHCNKIDFIKMDVEGAELDALKGARQIIQEYKPKLAISGYHKPEDFWTIPFKMHELNPEYKIYFNHHRPIIWESVFYAHPVG